MELLGKLSPTLAVLAWLFANALLLFKWLAKVVGSPFAVFDMESLRRGHWVAVVAWS